MIYAFDSIQVSLVDGVDPNKTGFTVGSRLAPLANVDGRGTGGRVVDALPPIACAVAQIVQVPHRDVCQSLVLRLPKYGVGPLQYPLRGPSVQPSMGLIDFHQ